MITVTQLRPTSINAATKEAVNALLKQLSPGEPVPEEAALRHLLEQPGFVLVCAQSDGRIVGMASVYFQHTLKKQTAWVEDVIVDEAFRGHGIGKMLVGALISVAREHGADDINLTSRPERIAANHLYEKLGFKKRKTNVWRLTLEA